MIDLQKASIQELHSNMLDQRRLRLLMLRLDAIHPVVSGNKIFKLQHYLQQAGQAPHLPVVTFGGAFSNHLVATAFACRQAGLKCIGIVRGEEPKHLSPTLAACKAYGMHLKFVSRKEYAATSASGVGIPESFIIPEGGFGEAGAAGAAGIMKLVPAEATHIITAIGTGTTLSGILRAAVPAQGVIAVPVIKNMQDLAERIQALNGKKEYPNLHTWPDYHFGGYAKKNQLLIDFINGFYREHQVPLDFVYTGKMVYGVMRKIEEHFFAPGSVICCIHTGGLQGNLSLPAGTLDF